MQSYLPHFYDHLSIHLSTNYKVSILWLGVIK